jgi:DHA1 family bicyclomycin/chloramphenicol resistance-like MFS transporter
MGPFTLDAYSPGFPAMSDEFAAPHAIVQLSVTAGLVGLATGQVLAAALSERFGRRALALWAIAGFTVLTAATGLAPTLPALIAMRVLQGAAAAIAVAMSRTIGRDAFEGRSRGVYYAQLTAATGVAPVFGPIAAAAVMQLGGSWRWISVMLAVFAAAAWLVVWLSLPETRPSSARVGRIREGFVHMARLARRSQSWVAIVGIGLAGGIVLAYLAGTSYLLQERYGLTPSEYSIVFAFNALAIVASGQVATLLLRRVTPERLLAAAFTAEALLGVGLGGAVLVGAPLPVIISILFGVLFGYGIAMSMMLTVGMSVPEQDAPAMSALLGIGQFGLGAITAPLAASATDAPTPSMAIVIVGYAVCGVLLAVLLSMRAHRIAANSGSLTPERKTFTHGKR